MAAETASNSGCMVDATHTNDIIKWWCDQNMIGTHGKWWEYDNDPISGVFHQSMTSMAAGHWVLVWLHRGWCPTAPGCHRGRPWWHFAGLGRSSRPPKKKTMGTSKKCLVSDYWWVHEGYRLLITIWVDETNEAFGFGTLVAGKLKESDPRGTCQKLRPRTPRRKAWLVASQTASCCAVHVRMASAWNFCAGMGDKKTEVPEVTAMICYHLEAKNSTSSLLITISNQHINHY